MRQLLKQLVLCFVRQTVHVTILIARVILRMVRDVIM
jgi:hypothetical protein